MQVLGALLALWFGVNARFGAAWTGSKCGAPQVESLLVHPVRVVGGGEATYGSHPWLVSLQKRRSHFCGGAILSDRWILTAAHCVASLSRDLLADVRVVAGEFDQRAEDEEEQVLPVEAVSVHEKYHQAWPMTYDVALVEVGRRIQFGTRVKPICLPLPDEGVPPGTGCLLAGWGRVGEKGRLPAVLREVRLDLVKPAKCKFVLQSVQGWHGRRRASEPPPAMTVLCAGPERGGRDACQGDSGGPLACPASSGGGHWVALGITSWGKGCGRSWGNNSGRHPSRRGSPGVFTDVRLLLPWIKLKLREADAQRHEKSTSSLCSVTDGPITESEGVIRNPVHPGLRYDNNQLCVWTVNVPPGFGVLLEFHHLDLEKETDCRHDRLTVSAGSRMVVGIFCGGVPPGRVLVSNSQNATLLFSSDINQAGSGFVVRHRALWGHADPGCGTVVLVQDQTFIHSPNFPRFYSHDCVARWVVYAPLGHIVKLDFDSFDLEESDACLYDSLTVLADVEGTEEIAVMCGGSVPPPVLSYHSLMVLHFTSDSSVARRGFRAAVTFISHADLHSQDSAGSERGTVLQDFLAANQRHTISHGSSGGADPAVDRSSSRTLTPGEGPEEPRPHMDDEDDGGESSGST